MTTDRAAKLVFIGQNLALGNMDDAHEHPHHHASPVSYPPQQQMCVEPQPSTSRDPTASSIIPTVLQLDSVDTEYLKTEDSEG